MRFKTVGVVVCWGEGADAGVGVVWCGSGAGGCVSVV